VLDTLASWAEEFIAVFIRGGQTFVGLVTGIVPTLIVLLTAVNALVAWIGPERVNKFGEWAGREGFIYTPIRYLIWPFLSVFFLTYPMAYTNGQFLPEKYKPAFYDSAVSMVHPPLGIFPHVNPGELFVWLGIATGIEALGLRLSDLAVRYLITGLIVIYIRGLVTERLTAIMSARQAKAATA
jgi:PTS system glucitol/sorbitol-specific IIC component